MGLRGSGGRIEDRWRTRGYEERCARIHVLVRRAVAGKQRHGGMYTHLDMCASAFSKTLKASSCPRGAITDMRVTALPCDSRCENAVN